MTHHPYGPDELDRADPELEGVAHELERYATSQRGQPPPDLVGRIHAAIDAEPDPERHWWTSLLLGPGSWRPVGRMMAAAAVLAIAVLGAVALGQVIDSVRPDVGTSPQPSPVTRPSESQTPSPSPSPTPTPTASPTPTPSVEPSLTVTPTPPPATASPTASDDDDDEDETPEPSESDNSGPGGGGGDD